MIVAADSLVLTQKGFFHTRSPQLAVLGNSFGYTNQPVYCKPTQDCELYEFETNYGHIIRTMWDWMIGSEVPMQKHGCFGILDDPDAGAVMGLLSRGVIVSKNSYACLYAQHDYDSIKKLFDSVTKNCRKVEQYIEPSEYILGGSNLFDYISSYEPDPDILNVSVPKFMFAANSSTIAAYLRSLTYMNYVRRVDDQYVIIMDLSTNLFARQVQLLLHQFGIISKIVNKKSIALDFFEFGKFVGFIGVYDNLEYISALYDRATSKPSPSFATIVSATPYERVACTQVHSSESTIINGLLIKPSSN